MRNAALLVTLFLIAGTRASCAQEFHPTHPVLPDAATATQVGCLILHAYFPNWEGRKTSPGCAADSTRTGVWDVYAKLAGGGPGGSPEVELSKDDGRVLRIYMTE